MATIIDKSGHIAFFGHVSWGNLVDWMVTLCLGLIISLTTLALGGVRPDTHLVLLPLFVLLLCLHGLWLALDQESPKRLSQVPLWFVPGLLWMLASVLWWSPVPWRGWTELLYALEAFILLWVLANNVRTRAHLWLLIIMSLSPATLAVFNGFYQFFQRPEQMLGALTGYPLALSEVFLGRATGSFADPNSFAAFLLMLLPSLLVAAAVTRLPKILRLLCFYIALMVCVGIALTQSYWAVAVGVVLLSVVPWFCFRRVKRRILFSLSGVLLALLFLLAMVVLHPLFKKGLQHALSDQGEGVRLVLWQEAWAMIQENPIFGVGAGAYRSSFEQSPRVALAELPLTPHNDYLLFLSQLGVVGFLCWAIPCSIVFVIAWRAWRREAFAVKLRDSDAMIMPPQRFFLSLGLCGSIACALSMLSTFVCYVPALIFYGVLAFSILLKTSFKRSLVLPEHWVHRVAYLLLVSCVGGSFYVLASNKLQSQALELRALEELEHVVDMRLHMSGDSTWLNQVIRRYEDALVLDQTNGDAWIGLSAAICQLYFKSPAKFDQVGARAVSCAQRAIELSPDYWKPWAQLGVAHSFHGDLELAEEALRHALSLAPNNSNAHYYYAAFLSGGKDRLDEALASVQIALEINPHNVAARRLQQKLLIL
ncbi:O-antigen ligase family protein [Coraliomargarita sp. SDUM461004]|uniref:O-antigen ligase family protein n=1 Tax=Thalassobacterium sedimentorum TaxID=3041258 RepID=A0ABU1AFN7_9BACT|nr:O-antigen ligase family protein [Coraliomargarita sp. SDUM461004]MDQ8193573.1 O-antigen ligase family protein [Coraliomargarita sp. SDUM461004]